MLLSPKPVLERSRQLRPRIPCQDSVKPPLSLTRLGNPDTQEELENAAVEVLQPAAAMAGRELIHAVDAVLEKSEAPSPKEVWDTIEAEGGFRGLAANVTQQLLAALDRDVIRKEAELAEKTAQANSDCSVKLCEQVFGKKDAAEASEADSQPKALNPKPGPSPNPDPDPNSATQP